MLSVFSFRILGHGPTSLPGCCTLASGPDHHCHRQTHGPTPTHDGAVLPVLLLAKYYSYSYDIMYRPNWLRARMYALERAPDALHRVVEHRAHRQGPHQT